MNQIQTSIHEGEKWRATIKKRPSAKHHKIEIIKPVAELIEEQVDLENPDKILHMELLGNYSGIPVLTPKETFSIIKPYPKQ